MDNPAPYQESSETVTVAEHISPIKTGDNIEARRMAGYVWNSTTSQWQRNTNVDPATSAKQDTLLTELQLKADLTETQPVTVVALPTIFNGSKTVATGTATAIATTQAIHSVTVKALSTNTVAVYVGGTGVTTSTGFELLAGESISLDIDNLADVFVISTVASQEIRWIAV